MSIEDVEMSKPRTEQELRDFLEDFSHELEEVFPHEVEVFLKHCKTFGDIEDRILNIDDFPEFVEALRLAAVEAGTQIEYGTKEGQRQERN
jgi:hypothetical protein